MHREVLRFEKNAASVAPDMPVDDNSMQETTILFAGDNVDHNILTIDGQGTFHGMGIIAALTPGKTKDRIIPRKIDQDLNLSMLNTIPFIEHRFAKHARESILFKELPEMMSGNKKVDIMWEMSLSFKQEIPGWQGMMHILNEGKEHPGKSSVLFLPMIDLYSGDKTCILSTLSYISET